MIDKEKQIQRFMFSMFAFSEEETAAMGKIIPMTQEIFYSCMDKCMVAGEMAEVDFDYLIGEFPEMADRYMEKFVEKNAIKHKVYEGRILKGLHKIERYVNLPRQRGRG